VTSHPEGCAANVQEQISFVQRNGALNHAPKRVLVVGASTGYGLASRISAAFEKAAHAAGLYAKSINGDAFSDEIKRQTIELIKSDLGQIDLLVYSLASPRRTHPKTGVTHKSVLKPLDSAFTAKTVDSDKGLVNEVTIDPANEQEIADTVAVMGGEDWKFWVDALEEAGVVAQGFTTVAYSYIGPDLTWAVYRNGTIGKAKENLEATAKQLYAQLAPKNGRAYVSVNKALVTQASSAIPVVPLYISLLYKVMKEKGLHEGCIEQIQRLFKTQLYNGSNPAPDKEGRLRVDDLEMRDDVQRAVADLWPQVNTENLETISDIEGYRSEFLKLFGFGIPGVDYQADVDPAVGIPSL